MNNNSKTVKEEHFVIADESDDHPYKTQCNCGRWFYIFFNHIDCVRKGCHEEQYHQAIW